MKTKINERLRRVLSKHFISKLFAKVAVPIQADRAAVLAYWQACPTNLKHTSLCFFSKELIELVNNTNTKLLYADFLIKTNRKTESVRPDPEYHLLNSFELLWNVEGQQADDCCEKIAEQSVEEMNLVDILSHEPKQEETKEARPEPTPTVMGHACSVKMECLDTVLQTCSSIRPASFL